MGFLLGTISDRVFNRIFYGIFNVMFNGIFDGIFNGIFEAFKTTGYLKYSYHIFWDEHLISVG